VLEELQTIAETLAGRLGRSVAIDDPEFRLLVHTAQDSQTADRHWVESIMQKAVDERVIDWTLSHGVATATSPVRIAANDELGLVSRMCLPVRCQGILVAYLWLLDADTSLSKADLRRAVESAATAGECLFRERLLGDLRRSRERELLRDLFASSRSVRDNAAEELAAAGRVPSGAGAAVMVCQVRGRSYKESTVVMDLALLHAARQFAPMRSIWTPRGGADGVLLVAGRQQLSPDALQTAGRELHAKLADTAGDEASIHIGLGPVVPSVARANESYVCAQDALRVAEQVPGLPAVVAWDMLGIYRLLVRLPMEQLQDDAIPAGLRQLFSDDESGVLAETLEVYLDEAGRAQQTFERLQIHRTSLYYRLSRIEALTGMRLTNGGDRLALHLGIKLARLSGLWRTTRAT
jgi:hypothetical protein